MSGFVAIVNTDGAPVDRDLLERLTDTLCFRGPDRQKVWIDGQVGFGHTLFKTTDEAQYEHQPASLEGEVWITGSARIDARPDLINKLGLQSEIRLDHTPDSDLILYAYYAWGEKCLDNLLGDFAFVLWDKRKKRLFCARDRFGMRQLYYAHAGSSLVVSNSLYCVLQHPAVSRRFDDRAIGDFLLFGNHTWLDKKQTAFADIRTLQPAHTLFLDNGNLTTHRYWDIPFDVPLLRYRKERDYIEHFQEVFNKSVADRIRTSSVVISMSGGMDSSSIAATLMKLKKDNLVQPVEVSAVTAVYDRILPCQERYYAGLVADELSLPVHYIAGDDYPLLGPSLATTCPIENYTPAFSHKFMRQIAAFGRVVLSGASADNLLAVSPVRSTLAETNPVKVLFDIFRLRRRYGMFPPFGTGLLAKLKGRTAVKTNWFDLPHAYPSWIAPEFEARMGMKERWLEWFSWQPSTTSHPRHPGAYNALVGPDWNVDDVYFHENDFTYPEVMDPYLDVRLINFIFSLPSLPWLFQKYLLRQAMTDVLPKEIINRPKTPLGAIHDVLLNQSESGWVDQWKATGELSEYVDRSRVPAISNGSAAERNSSYLHLRPLLLNIWISHATKLTSFY